MHLQKLEIENYGTYKKVTVVFDTQGEVIGVVGLNNDDSGCASNGAGKTQFFEAIGWCLFGKTVRQQDNTTSIIREGAEFCNVSVKFDTGFAVNRTRDFKGGSSVDIFDGEWHNGLGVRDAQEMVARELGFNVRSPFSDFMNLVFFSTSAAKSFTSDDLDPIECYRIVSEFLSLQVFDEAMKIARSEHRAFELQEAVLNERVKALSTTISETSVDELNERLEEVSNRITNLAVDISYNAGQLEKLQGFKRDFVASVVPARAELENFVRRLEGQIDSWVAEKKAAENEYSEDFLSSLVNNHGTLDSKLHGLRVDLQQVHDEHDKLVDKSSELVNSLIVKQSKLSSEFSLMKEQFAHLGGSNGGMDCPECGVHLVLIDGSLRHVDKDAEDQLCINMNAKRGEVDLVTTRIKDLRAQEKQGKDALNAKMTSITLQVSSTEKSLQEVTREIHRIEHLKDVLASFNDRVSDMKASLSDGKKTLSSKIDEVCRTVFDCHAEGISDFPITWEILRSISTDRIEEKIDIVRSALSESEKTKAALDERKQVLHGEVIKHMDMTTELEAVNVSLKEISSQVSDADYWTKTFPKVARELVDRFLPALSSVANRYLEKMGVVNLVRFEIDREAKKKTFAVLVFDGKKYRGMKSFSNGERARIAIALGFALRELSGAGKAGANVGFLVVDELLDRVDDAGVDLFFDLLDGIDGMKFIISHKPESTIRSYVDKMLVIEKTGGISQATLSTV